MNRKAIQILLWGTSGALLLGSVVLPVCLLGSSDLKTEEPLPVELDPERSLVAPVVRKSTVPPLSEWAAIWQRPIRPPEVDVPPSLPPDATRPDVREQTPPPELRVTLLATAIETGGDTATPGERTSGGGASGGSRAVLRDADNQVVVKRVGDITSGARVVRIEAHRVTFEHRGREVTLTLPHAGEDRAGPASAWRDEP